MKLQNISDNVKSLASTNERLTSELSVVKNENNVLENRIVNLEKQQAKNEQYGCCNNVGAFDIVEHDILLSKLEHYSIHGLANEWLKSYLSNRKQCFN